MRIKDWIDYLGSIQDDETRKKLRTAYGRGHPPRVNPAKRFERDARVIRRFFNRPNPTKVSVRAASWVHVVYGFGDASGEGFGDAFQTLDGISFRHGVWIENVPNE